MCSADIKSYRNNKVKRTWLSWQAFIIGIHICTYFNYVSSSLKKTAGQFFVALNFKIAFDCTVHYKRMNVNELTLCN
jgi:hypothetical protein